MADPTNNAAQPAQAQAQGGTHTVAPGDTLSAIGAKYGVSWQNIYQANKATVGQNPNLVRPGMVLQIPGQGGAASGNATDFKLAVPTTVDSSVVSKSMTNPITQQDLEDAVANNKNLATAVAKDVAPSQKENDLSNQIGAIRDKEAQSKLALEKYENNLPQEGISEYALRGRSGAMARDVNLDIQTLVLQEKTLAAELGVEVKSRTAQLSSDKTSMANNDKVISDYNAMQRVIDSQKTQVQSETNKLASEAKSTINTVLTHFKDTSWENLTPDTQKQLGDLATQAGVPLELLQAGMKANANQAALNKIKTDNAILLQQKSLNKPAPKPKGAVVSGNATFSPDNIGGLGQALEAHKGTDGYADTSVYVQALGNWTKAGGLPKDFTRYFPPKTYLNPNDDSVPASLKATLPKAKSPLSSGVTGVPGL